MADGNPDGIKRYTPPVHRSASFCSFFNPERLRELGGLVGDERCGVSWLESGEAVVKNRIGRASYEEGRVALLESFVGELIWLGGVSC